LAVGVLRVAPCSQFCVAARQLLPVNNFVGQFAVGLTHAMRVAIFSECLKKHFIFNHYSHACNQTNNVV
jgi:hypothetical protein